MARSNHRRHGLTIPVAMIAGFAPLVSITYTGYKAGGLNGAVSNAVTSVLPYDPINKKITFANLGYGLFPMIAGMMVHKIVGGTLGVNRWLASSGIPWVRV